MAVAITLRRYLDEHADHYEVLTHAPAPSASRVAEASHISGDNIAKGVLLKDGAGYVLAVLPASRDIEFDELRGQLDRQVSLAEEPEITSVFPDCEAGAVPAIGGAYGIKTIVDDSLAEQPDVYFEGGDHASLIRVGSVSFERLTAGAEHGRFSRHR